MADFKNAIDIIKKQYFTFEEFPLLPRERFPIGLIPDIEALKEDEIDHYALTLRADELEGLLLDLRTMNDPVMVLRIAKIMTKRISARLAILISYLYQYHYDKDAVKESCRFIRKNASSFFLEYNGFLRRFGGSTDIVRAVAKACLEEDMLLSELCEKYAIIELSPLAQSAFILFFYECEKIDILKNLDQLIGLVRSAPKEHLVEPISHYLDILNLLEFDDTVNLEIAERLGQPYLSADWEPFAVEFREKYAHWNYLHRLKLHCDRNPKKYHLLVRYFEYVRSNYMIEQNDYQLLVMDFGWIILVDDRNSKDAYLYRRDLFEKEIAQWESDERNLPTFLDVKKETLTAREFMLSVKDAPCIKFTFDDIHYFYIDEVMEIKLKIEPDLRMQRLKKK